MGAPVVASSGCGGLLAMLLLPSGLILLLISPLLGFLLLLLGALFFVAGTIQLSSARARIAVADAEALRTWQEMHRR